MSVQTHEKYQRLIDAARAEKPVVTAVAHPCDESSLDRRDRCSEAGLDRAAPGRTPGEDHAGREDARPRYLAVPDLRYRSQSFGGSEGRRARARGEGRSADEGKPAHRRADGRRRQARNGLRTARRISHCFVLDVPSYDAPMIISDAAVNIAPTLADKVDIVQNAIDLAHALRFKEVRVAILSAMETVNPNVPSTIEAAALCKMADRGQITGGILDGPLALDNAISLESVQIKKIISEVAGRANVLIVPDLEAGNMLAKSLIVSRARRCRRNRARREGADHPHQPRRLRHGPARFLRGGDPACSRAARNPDQSDRLSHPMADAILVINAGSSSIKFSLFVETANDLEPVVRGQASGLVYRAALHSHGHDRQDGGGKALGLRSEGRSRWRARSRHRMVEDDLRRRTPSGGCRPSRRSRWAWTTPPRSGSTPRRWQSSRNWCRSHRCISRTISRRSAFCSRSFRDLPQVACFDTAFHRTNPAVAQMFALPAKLTEAGVRRYGFHGLSYEYIASVLPAFDERAAKGKTVVLHLGNGASMCALSNGVQRCEHDGVHRSRWIADGHALRSHRPRRDPVSHGSGHGRAGDREADLQRVGPARRVGHLERHAHAARLRRPARESRLRSVRLSHRTRAGIARRGALRPRCDRFHRRYRRERVERADAVCKNAGWLGIEIDDDANASGGPRIAKATSPTGAWVIPTNEELMIARHTRRVLGG